MSQEEPVDLQKRILKFFQEQPQAVETARGINAWVSAEPEALEEVLKDLVHRKWLLALETSAVTGYTLTQDQRFLGQIEKILRIS